MSLREFYLKKNVAWSEKSICIIKNLFKFFMDERSKLERILVWMFILFQNSSYYIFTFISCNNEFVFHKNSFLDFLRQVHHIKLNNLIGNPVSSFHNEINVNASIAPQLNSINIFVTVKWAIFLLEFLLLKIVLSILILSYL